MRSSLFVRVTPAFARRPVSGRAPVPPVLAAVVVVVGSALGLLAVSRLVPPSGARREGPGEPPEPASMVWEG